MEYWPSHSKLCLGYIYMPWNIAKVSELCIRHISMPRNIDPVTLYCASLPMSHFFGIRYWPSHSDLCLGHIFMAWNISPVSQNIEYWLSHWIIIPPETKFRGGILDSPCSSTRPSVRPSVRPWVGVRMITLILFSGFKNFFLHISLGSRSCMGLNISVLPH